MLDTIFNEGEDLAKIFAIEALLNYYEFNNNLSLTKFKNMAIINSWRINIKICEFSEQICLKVSKVHFKTVFEPMFLKFMSSTEP